MITSRQLMVWKWWERMVFLNEFWLKGPWIFIFFVLWSTCNLACSFAFFPFTASHSEQLTFSRHIRFDTFSLNENPIRKLKIFYFSLPQISHNFQSGQSTFRFSSSCTGVCQKVIKYRARWKIDDLLRLDFFLNSIQRIATVTQHSLSCRWTFLSQKLIWDANWVGERKSISGKKTLFAFCLHAFCLHSSSLARRFTFRRRWTYRKFLTVPTITPHFRRTNDAIKNVYDLVILLPHSLPLAAEPAQNYIKILIV